MDDYLGNKTNALNFNALMFNVSLIVYFYLYRSCLQLMYLHSVHVQKLLSLSKHRISMPENNINV